MFRHKLSLLIYVLIGLAVFGFATQLFTNTATLLTNLLIMVAIGVALYAVVYYFFLRKRTSNDMKKYKKAVKQSKLRNKYPQSKNAVSQAPKKQTAFLNKKRSKKSRATHLRVIEGNKQKRKNRASY